MRFRLCMGAAFLVPLTACAPPAAPPGPQPFNVPPVLPDTARPLMVADSEASLWPDPVERTYVRLSSLQHVLDRHRRQTGQFPPGLELLFPDSLTRDIQTRDGWGGPIVYEPTVDDYRLTSAGSDRAAGTADDLVMTSTSEMPVFVRPEGTRTRAILQSLQMLVTIYESRTGALPERLEDLPLAGLRPYLGTMDEWQRAIEFSRRENDFELRSAGPDGRRNTTDDLVLQGRDVPARRTP